MATYFWKPSAINTSEVNTVDLSTATRLRVTLGGITITGDVASGATNVYNNLVSAIRDAAHPWFQQYTLSLSGNTMTAKSRPGVPVADAGATCPFEEFSGGWNAGSITEADGRCFVSSAENWRDVDGSVSSSAPGTGDTVIIDDTDEGLIWGWDVDMGYGQVFVGPNFTGCFGLNRWAMTKSYNGLQVADVPEYRADRLMYFDLNNTLFEIQGSPVRLQARVRHNNAGDIIRINSTATSPQRGAPAVICLWMDEAALVSRINPSYQIDNGSIMIGTHDNTNYYLQPNINVTGGQVAFVGEETTVPAECQIDTLTVYGGDVTLNGMSVNDLEAPGGTVRSIVGIVADTLEVTGGTFDARKQINSDYSTCDLTAASGKILTKAGIDALNFASYTINVDELDEKLTLQKSTQEFDNITLANTLNYEMELVVK